MRNVTLSAVENELIPINIKEGSYKIASTTLMIATGERVGLKSITGEIAAFLAQCPVRDGIVQISSLHTTAGLIVNEVQEALLSDVTSLFEQLIPCGVYYRHNDPRLSDCARKNADAHLRTVVAGLSLLVPLVDGQLKLGAWQNIILAEFDGPNERKV